MKQKILLTCLTLGLFFIFPSTLEASIQSPTWAELAKNAKNYSYEYQYSQFRDTSRFANSLAAFKVPNNTAIILTLDETLNTNDIVEGSQISFTVAKDVIISNRTIIRKGQKVTAELEIAKGNGGFGKSAHILVNDFSVKATDGTVIPLAGSISKKGQSRSGITTGFMAVTLVLCFPLAPLFGFIRGKDITIPAGFEKTVYTYGDVYLNNVS